MKKPVDRRLFFKGCLSAVSSVLAQPSVLWASGPAGKSYNRVLLVDRNQQPITSEMLKPKTCYIFHYPFVTTPCFLINTGQSLRTAQTLRTENGAYYEWQGGAGPDNAVVAFAAICAHKLSYPTRSISFINYHAERAPEPDTEASHGSSQQVIFCCSERSAYNPLEGARPVSGPAGQPLTAITLDYDHLHDHYYAVGTQGGDQYDKFFEQFGFNLSFETQLDDISEWVKGHAVIYKSDAYSHTQQSC